MKTIAIIPARMGSQRLPGKPLIMIKGKPLIQYVWENTVSPLIDHKVVATDDKRIMEAVIAFGGEAILTDPAHQNGSSRCAEVARAYPKYDIILNIQGDEPMVNEKVIRGLLEPFGLSTKPYVTTLKTPLPPKKVDDPHTVKVVCNHQGYAIYFSRSPIPYNRDGAPLTYYKHLGFYGFRRGILLEYVKIPPSSLENIEKLEQLRILEAGIPLYVSECQEDLIDINTKADLKKFKDRLK